MKVCWLSNYFSPYKIKLFNEVGKHVDLTCVILGGRDKNRNDEWTIENNYSFKYYVIDNKFKEKIKEYAKTNDILIDSMYSTKYGIIATNEFKKQNKKIVMHADGGIAGNRGFFIKKIISYFMKRHHCFLSSGPVCDEYYSYFGVEKNKVFNYRFSSLTSQDILDNKELIKDKNKIREKLNIDDKFTIISVGQPIKRKGFDILLDAYKESNLSNIINLLIVGGEPQKNIKEFVENNNLNNVKFVGLLDSNSLKEYYAVSDAFALMTRYDIWGLVIEEAMSFGLPILTSNKCAAGIHFSNLTNFVKTIDINDKSQCVDGINEIYNFANNISKNKEDYLKIIEEYTIENSAKDIIDILSAI